MKQRKKETTSQTNRETKKARMAENLKFCRNRDTKGPISKFDISKLKNLYNTV